jgi:photosystem II stability/assembly factor-like uncharacterized protein
MSSIRPTRSHWKQASVPVSSDLTAVFFVDDKQGWAVGHDGVILHTADGGEKWDLQLSGRTANDLLIAAMERKVAAEPASDDAKKLLVEAQRYKEQGADKPFLDVWFADTQNGYAVGAYNLLVRTRDGGKTWESWFDRTDNPKFFNFYAIRPAAGELFIAGEGGLVLKLDGAAQRFRGLAVPYNGSFFGVTDAGSAVVVFGLRGKSYRSDDRGATWTKVDAGLPASVVAQRAPRRERRCSPTSAAASRPTSDGGRTFGKVALRDGDAAHRNCRCGRGKARVVGARGAQVTAMTSALTARTLRKDDSTWSPLRSKPNRCRWSAISRTSTPGRATGSNGWCSTTGWPWLSSARSSPLRSRLSRRRVSR